MNTKILVSLLVIGISAIAIGGAMTGAFFTDTETSTGNTFAAGAIDLQVDNHCYYDGFQCINGYWNGETDNGACACNWDMKNLGTEKFFDLADIKPGDYGEDTISLHVTSNPAWACVTLTKTADDDVTCTDPELADDAACSEPNADLFDGELGSNLQFVLWADTCNTGGATPGDNVYQPACDKLLTYGPASDISTIGTTYTLADSLDNNVGGTVGEGLDPDTTYYIGAAWCLGTINTNTLACDGTLVNNAPQTDDYKADISFMVEQQRNNDNFKCNQ